MSLFSFAGRRRRIKIADFSGPRFAAHTNHVVVVVVEWTKEAKNRPSATEKRQNSIAKQSHNAHAHSCCQFQVVDRSSTTLSLDAPTHDSRRGRLDSKQASNTCACRHRGIRAASSTPSSSPYSSSMMFSWESLDTVTK